MLLEVADTGAGIPDEEIGEVWQELARGRAARSLPGTGIGLALVRVVVTRHGGRVAIRSRDGQGTVVSIRLPVQGASRNCDRLSRSCDSAAIPAAQCLPNVELRSDPPDRKAPHDHVPPRGAHPRHRRGRPHPRRLQRGHNQRGSAESPDDARVAPPGAPARAHGGTSAEPVTAAGAVSVAGLGSFPIPSGAQVAANMACGKGDIIEAGPVTPGRGGGLLHLGAPQGRVHDHRRTRWAPSLAPAPRRHRDGDLHRPPVLGCDHRDGRPEFGRLRRSVPPAMSGSLTHNVLEITLAPGSNPASMPKC